MTGFFDDKAARDHARKRALEIVNAPFPKIDVFDRATGRPAMPIEVAVQSEDPAVVPAGDTAGRNVRGVFVGEVGAASVAMQKVRLRLKDGALAVLEAVGTGVVKGLGFVRPLLKRLHLRARRRRHRLVARELLVTSFDVAERAFEFVKFVQKRRLLLLRPHEFDAEPRNDFAGGDVDTTDFALFRALEKLARLLSEPDSGCRGVDPGFGQPESFQDGSQVHGGSPDGGTAVRLAPRDPERESGQ